MFTGLYLIAVTLLIFSVVMIRKIEQFNKGREIKEQILLALFGYLSFVAFAAIPCITIAYGIKLIIG